MLRLILDAMGGDHGPYALLEGAQLALPELKTQPGELVIVGDEALILPILEDRKYRLLSDSIRSKDPTFRVRIAHSSQTIEMGDSIRAIRSKPEASINIGCRIAGESYKALQSKISPAADKFADSMPTAFISAGNSGAVMASALVQMGRLGPVERPAIAVRLPTLSPDGCVIIDAGANVDCKPESLRDFSIMGAIYAQVDRKSVTLPKIGVLSNGEEKSKGTELTRAAVALIEKLSCFHGPGAVGEFVGYAEGKDIFKGHIDVAVTDGFVGNVVLKSVEGLGSAFFSTLKSEAKSSPLAALGFALSAGAFKRFVKKFDYAETGAAPLLGVGGYVFISHGRSNSKAIKSALLRARTAVKGQYVEKLEHALSHAAAS